MYDKKVRNLCNSLILCRYDPYGRNLTIEEYDQEDMRTVRRRAIERAQSAQRWGLVMGTLGRQGNPALVDKLEALLEAKNLEYSVVLMSEVTPESLTLMPDIEAWIQVACPRYAESVFDDQHRRPDDMGSKSTVAAGFPAIRVQSAIFICYESE